MTYNIDILKTSRSQELTKDYCYHVALEQCTRAEAAEARAAELERQLAAEQAAHASDVNALSKERDEARKSLVLLMRYCTREQIDKAQADLDKWESYQ